MVNDLKLYANADDTIRIQYEDEDGDPIDISGYTFFFTIKSAKSDDATDSDALLAVDQVIASGTAGIADILIDKDDMDIDEGNYIYDINFLDGLGYVKVFVQGDVKIVDRIGNRNS